MLEFSWKYWIFWAVVIFSMIALGAAVFGRRRPRLPNGRPGVPTSELEELTRLYERGEITATEFDRRRIEIERRRAA